jgi:hypothetical protein
MSPLQVGTLVTSILFTVIKVMTSALEIAAHKHLIDPNISELVTIGACVSWVGFFTAYCRDQALQRMQVMETRIKRVIDSYGEQCLEDGRLDAARAYARASTNPDEPTQRRFSIVD